MERGEAIVARNIRRKRIRSGEKRMGKQQKARRKGKKKTTLNGHTITARVSSEENKTGKDRHRLYMLYTYIYLYYYFIMYRVGSVHNPALPVFTVVLPFFFRSFCTQTSHRHAELNIM